MKKFLGIMVLGLLVCNFGFTKDLKNPGDVMIDYEGISQNISKCDPSCRKKIPIAKFPEYPQEFSKKWKKENIIKEAGGYSNFKEHIYKTGHINIGLARACLIGKKSYCHELINGVENVVKNDLLRPTGWKKWPHPAKKVKNSDEVFLFEKYYAGSLLESYAIALKATGKKPVDGLEEWFYRRYEPYLRYYIHQTGYHKDPKWKKFKGKKVPQNHLLEMSNMHLSLLSILNNAEKFEQELEIWDLYMTTMNKDGSFPLEAERGAKSLSYQAKTIMGLFKTAHMAEIQGYDLWNKKLDKDWQNLHHAITFLLNGFEDQSTVWKYAKKNQSAGNTKKYKEQDLRHFPTEISFYWYYKRKFPNHPNIKKFENLKFDTRTCKVPRKQRMSYCLSEDYIVTFKYILKMDVGGSFGLGKGSTQKQNDFMGHRCFYFSPNEYPNEYVEASNVEYIALVKNKTDDSVIIKVRAVSKELAIEEAMKKCTEKHEEGCYVHYSNQVGFGQ